MATGVVLRAMRLASRSKWVDRKLTTLASGYLDVSRGFSYNFDENGEQTLLERIAQTAGGRPLFFDVGANVGEWSARALECLPTAEGHLFEAAPGTYEELKRRVGSDPRLFLNRLALADSEESRQFRSYGKNFGGNTLVVEAGFHRGTSEIINVPTARGARYCADRRINHINIVKIDVEGAELEVLYGFRELVDRQAIDVVQFEYGYTHADMHTTMRDFFEFFEERGYVVGPLRKDGVHFKKFEYKDNEFRSGPNYVACRPALCAALGPCSSGDKVPC